MAPFDPRLTASIGSLCPFGAYPTTSPLIDDLFAARGSELNFHDHNFLRAYP
jgi:hypothetical protein